jgi:nicotinamide mononucleotide transporter
MENILQNVQEAILGMRMVELISVISAIIYVVLAAQKNIWCWFFGIISAILWTYAAYAYYQLYIDSALQVYYVVMGFYGWYMWKYGYEKEGVELPMTQLSTQNHLYIIGVGLVLTFLVGYFFNTYTAAAATYLDAFTTIFSIMTTVLVARKVIENWLYWIVIDAAYIYLYGTRGGYLFAFLNVVYVIIAIIGYINWKKEYDLSNEKLTIDN